MIIQKKTSGEFRVAFAETPELYLGYEGQVETGPKTVYAYAKEHWGPVDSAPPVVLQAAK